MVLLYLDKPRQKVEEMKGSKRKELKQKKDQMNQLPTVGCCGYCW